MSSLLGSGVLIAQSDCVFIRGNVVVLGDAGEATVDTNDAVAIFAYLYLGVSAPECMDAADVNDNGLIEPSDYTYLIQHIFNDGPPPPAPFPGPGTDPTPGVSVSDERDPRFSYSIESSAGVPSQTGLELELRVTNEEPMHGLQIVLEYNRRDDDCPDLLIQEIRTEEGTLLSAESSEYIIAEWDNVEGVAFVAALKDFATPFAFMTGGDPLLPAGENQLVGTIAVAISACADMGVAEIGFADGSTLPNDNLTAEIPLPEGHNLIVLGSEVVRPVFGKPGGVEVRRGFIRGDANKDDGVDIGDPVFLLGFIFKGEAAPPCMDAADTNNDTRIDISDPIYLLSYLFTGGPQPSEPYPQAGVDPSDDGSESLGCESD